MLNFCNVLKKFVSLNGSGTLFPKDTYLKVSLVFVFVHPDSHYKNKDDGSLKDSAFLFPCTPDIDNLAKFALDGMTGVIFPDDNVIVNLTASKLYGKEAKTKICVKIAHA